MKQWQEFEARQSNEQASANYICAADELGLILVNGADAGDFTLQTVKPPAPVTTAKQEARPTERVTITPVSPGIALQATQKVPAPYLLVALIPSSLYVSLSKWLGNNQGNRYIQKTSLLLFP